MDQPSRQNRLMSSRLVAATVLVTLLFALLISCATADPDELADARARNVELENRVRALEQQVSEQQEEISQLENELALNDQDSERDLALEQLGELRANRRELLERIDELESAIISGRPEAIASLRLSDVTAEAEARSARTPEGAMADAIRGGSGFLRVSNLGLENDPRAAARYAARSPGIAADMLLGVPRLFDNRPDYDETLAYLAIIDPEGSRPRLILTTQYISATAPLFLRTVFVSIEGVDPVDPIDPIVLSGDPIRQTDGESIREALSIEADDDLVDRLSEMLSSSRFSITFVGVAGQETHYPSVSERSAMSNILFAFFDLRRR